MLVHRGTCLLVLLGAALGCARTSEKPKSEAEVPAAEKEVPAAVAATPNANHFEWKLKSTKPTLEATETQLSLTSGEIGLGSDRWACSYTIEKGQEEGGPRQELGFVSCKVGASGEMVETMVLCMESEGRPSDCGTGVLRVSDDGGKLHQLELSCRSASSECGGRPEVTERAVAGAVASDPAVAGPMGHFQWRVEVAEGGGGSSPKQLSSRRGDIDAGQGDWQCSYAIAKQADPSYPELELGYTTCKSKRSASTVETVLLCAENQERPSACNMGSLRLGREGGGVQSITMSCRNPSNPCW